MARYFFDLRDAEGFIVDDEGYELPDLIAVQREAVLSLADHSRYAVAKARGALSGITIEVRDDIGPVMNVGFNIDLLRKN